MPSKFITGLTHSAARVVSGNSSSTVERGISFSAASRPRAITFAFEAFFDEEIGADLRLTVDSGDFGTILDGMLHADPALAMKLMAERVSTVATAQFIDGLKTAAANPANLSRSMIV
jgi:hypothetical protein